MKYTLITGATTGIGFEFTQQFAQKQKNLILVARNESKLIELKNDLEKKYQIHVHVFAKDLSVENSANILAQEIHRQNLDVETLVNNAGVGLSCEFYKSSIADSQKMIQLNLQALTVLTQSFLPKMIQNKHGQILNVASMAGFQSGPYMAVYYATKAFVISLSEAIHEEVKIHNVSVTALCPGPVLTEFQQAANYNENEGPMHVSAAQVSRDGIQALEANKAIMIPGFLNRIVIQINRIIPRSWMRQLMKKRLAQRLS